MRKNLPVTQREVNMRKGARLITTTDLKGVITYCNEEFTEISGFSETELIGQAHNIIRHPDMPQAAFFTCQQHAPEHFWKADYQRHENTAVGMAEVIMLADQPLKYTKFFQGFVGTENVTAWDDGFTLKTGRGEISVVSPSEWRKHFPDSFAPDLAQGPRLAAYRIAVDDVEAVHECLRVSETTRLNYGRGVAIPPNEAYGVTIEFVAK